MDTNKNFKLQCSFSCYGFAIIALFLAGMPLLWLVGNLKTLISGERGGPVRTSKKGVAEPLNYMYNGMRSLPPARHRQIGEDFVLYSVQIYHRRLSKQIVWSTYLQMEWLTRELSLLWRVNWRTHIHFKSLSSLVAEI